MNWILIKMLDYKLRKAQRKNKIEGNTIVAKAREHMIESYKTTILFLSTGK